MTFDQALLVMHVLAASLWLGGGLSVAVVALRAQIAGDRERICRIGTEVEWFGSRVLMPSAVLACLSGLVLTWLVGSFHELWVMISLVAFALSAILALIFLGPTPGVLARLIEDHDPTSEVVQARIRRHFLYNRIEVALLTAVLVDMIVKPGG